MKLSLENSLLRQRLSGLVVLLLSSVLNVGCGGGGGTAPSTPPISIVAPAITVQPTIPAVTIGANATFTVAASGNGNLTYQWQRDGVDISGATAASYMLANAQMSDTLSKWRVNIKNESGTVSSNPVSLKVMGLDYLINGPQQLGIDTDGSVYQLSDVAYLTADVSGNVYVIDGRGTRISRIAPDGSKTVLAGRWGRSGVQDGAGNQARFNRLTELIVTASGDLYAIDMNSNPFPSENTGYPLIRKITAQGVVTTIAGGNTTSSALMLDGMGNQAKFDWPYSLTTDGLGNLYVLDGQETSLSATSQTNQLAGGNVRKIDPAGNVRTLVQRAAWGVFPSQIIFLGAYSWTFADSLGVDKNGNILIRYRSSSKTTLSGGLLQMSNSGKLNSINQSAQLCSYYLNRCDSAGNLYTSMIFGSADGNATSGFYQITPSGNVKQISPLLSTGGNDTVPELVVDGAGNLFAISNTDYSGGVIAKLPAGAAKFSTWINWTNYYSSMTFNALTVNPSGSVYSVNYSSDNIQKVAAPGILKPFASGFYPALGGCNNAFCSVIGVASDNAGNLYVTGESYDSSSRILLPYITQLDANGKATIWAGQFGRVGSVDGSRGSASFGGLGALAIDRTNNVYVLDVVNHSLRKISADGNVSTLATSLAVNQYSLLSVDGTGTVYWTEEKKDSGTVVLKSLNTAGSISELMTRDQILGMVADTAGNIFFTGSNGLTGDLKRSPVLNKRSPDGSITQLFDLNSQSAGLSNARHLGLGALTIDANNALYIASSGTILKYQM